jgi:radical SAM superfamily enzyme YgiQ (UPF0313 family)
LYYNKNRYFLKKETLLKKILLVNPPEMTQGLGSAPAFGLLWMIAYLRRHGFDPHFADGWVIGWKGIEESIIKCQPDILGVTAISGLRHKAFRIAEMAKRINPETIVVMGGIHATIMWKQVLENYPAIDIAVRGEGENTLLEIAQGKPLAEIDGIAYRHNGQIICNKNRELIPNLDDIPHLAWDLHDWSALSGVNDANRGQIIKGIDVSNEMVAPIIASRGCPGRCNFCPTWLVWKNWRCRSPENVIDEIEYLYHQYNIKHFKFLDDSFSIDRNLTVKLCDELERRKLRIAFAAQTRGDLIDQELLERLYSVGQYILILGVESGSQKILDIMGKDIDIKKLKENILIAKKIGYKINELLIVGNIGETIDTVNETVDFVKETAPDVTSVGHGLMLFPGTLVYQHAKKVGAINDDFWLTDIPYMMYTYDYPEAMLHSFAHAVYNRKRLPRSKFMIMLENHRFFARSIGNRMGQKLGIKKKKKYKGIKGYYPR